MSLYYNKSWVASSIAILIGVLFLTIRICVFNNLNILQILTLIMVISLFTYFT